MALVSIPREDRAPWYVVMLRIVFVLEFVFLVYLLCWSIAFLGLAFCDEILVTSIVHWIFSVAVGYPVIFWILFVGGYLAFLFSCLYKAAVSILDRM